MILKYKAYILTVVFALFMTGGCSANRDHRMTDNGLNKPTPTIKAEYEPIPTEAPADTDSKEEIPKHTEGEETIVETIPAYRNGSGMRDITTMELIDDMGLGINLGNTMEACGDWIGKSSISNYEKAWGSPIITKPMITGYKEAGFGVMRLPVAWSNLMGEDYTINPDLMDRVQTLVDWALESDLYVILNIHWDGGWWSGFSTDYEECIYRYTRFWSQIAERFKDYNDYLMFESLNEEGNFEDIWNRWAPGNDGKAEAYGILNRINQEFVDLIRESGSNNAKRHLLIAGYATDIELTCDELFQMPEDPIERLAVSVHYYTPSTFTILTEDASWGKARAEWGTEEDVALLNSQMDLVKETFMDKGIPVIIGEYGVAAGNKSMEMVRLYLTSVCEAAYRRNMCPVLWDGPGGLYNRILCKMNDSELEAAYKEIFAEAQDNK